MNVQRTMNADKYFRGLSDLEVELSRKKHGSNMITRKKRKSFFSQFLASFGDPIIKILLIALAVNVLFLFRDSGWYESVGIAVAVVVATFVSTLSEYGSEAAFEKLQKESGETSCRVRRNGELLLLQNADLVVGDTVFLQAGERIPADGTIVYGELYIDQSALNGETKEARKYCDETERPGSTDLSSRRGLFQGGVICEGEGVMTVVKVGDETFYGKMAAAVQEETIISPLKVRLQHLAKTISRMGYLAAVIVAIANLLNTFIFDSGWNVVVILSKISNPSFVISTLLSTLTLAITIIVMAVPEGLPMMITVVLSANMKKMLKDNVLVRKLVGIETAGSLNILFTDKTGTLTKGRLSVVGYLTGSGKYSDIDALAKSPALQTAILKGCIYNTDAAVSGGKHSKVIGGNSTDRALLEFASPYAKKLKKITLLAHTSFHSRSKYATSQIKEDGKTYYLIKGAPEVLLDRCRDYIDENGQRRPFQKSFLKEKMAAMGGDAIRMLALAQSDAPVEPVSSANLTFLGILGIRDQIRKEARPAITQITEAGIQTVMITGDNRETAVAIAKEAGLLGREIPKNAVFTSEELSRMSDAEIKQILKHIRVVSRALPTDKSRLVRIAQEMGLVAGMTGDGINDAPALKKADVGFAMGSGTEVAKEAGDIVIIDNNIRSIAKAILYGRTIFKSIRKFIIFQLTMNLCAVGLSVICPFLGIDAPLTVMQMLWVNMIMDTLAGLAFSGEAPLKEYMKEPPKKRDTPIINRYMYSQILFMGLYTIILCLLFLKLPLSQRIFGFESNNCYFMTAFFALFIFAGVFNSLNARTSRINLFAHIFSNRMFVGVMLLVSLIQILLIYSGGAVFRTTGIHMAHLQMIFLLAMSVIPADVIRKILLRSVGRKGYV